MFVDSKKVLCRCRRTLLDAERQPTEVQRRLDVYGAVLDAAAGRLRVVLVDAWYRERRPREIGETRATLLRPYCTERPAIWLPWTALFDTGGPSVADLVNEAARLLGQLQEGGNTGLVRYTPESHQISKL